jgi:hypothetical protein
MEIREATPEDNTQLLLLTSQNAMDGNISLRIDRYPYFFSILQKRGTSMTYVAEHDHKIIGCLSASESKVFVNHKSVYVHYLSDLKVDKTFQGGIAAFKLCKQMKEYLCTHQANLVMCTIAQGNHKMRPLLDGRLGLPKFHNLGAFHVFQFLPTRKIIKNSKVAIHDTPFTEELQTTFNSFYASYQLGKIVNLNDFQDRVLVVRKEGNIVAAISLFDPYHLKQNVIVRVNPFLGFMLNLSRKLPMPTLPFVGQAVRTIYINNFSYRQGNEDALVALVHAARHVAFLDHYHFVSLAIHSKDPLIKCFRRFLKITFHSEGLIATLRDDDYLIKSIISGIPFEDYSLV